MSFTEAIRAWLLQPVLEKLAAMEETMATKAELDAALDALQTQIDGLAADVAAAFKRLEDAVAAGGDFTAEMAALKAATDKLSALDVTAQGEGTTPPPVVP